MIRSWEKGVIRTVRDSGARGKGVLTASGKARYREGKRTVTGSEKELLQRTEGEEACKSCKDRRA